MNENEYQQTDKLLILSQLEDEFILEIQTQLQPQKNTALEGLYKSSGNFCTQCEAEGFRRITYYLDQPDIMSVFTTKIIADKKNTRYYYPMETRLNREKYQMANILSFGMTRLKNPLIYLP